jgi:DNA-binding GntR family transcriptional regulator
MAGFMVKTKRASTASARLKAADSASIERRGQRNGDGVEQALRERIASHSIPPGAKLLEQELSSEFGVSRSRIREVLGALEMRGLVERIPNRGAIVTRFDIAQVFAIYDVREVLEGLCARLATEKSPPESWEDLVRSFGKPMDELLQKGDIETYAEAYAAMRRRIIDAAQNQVLSGMLDSIYEKTHVIMRRVMILPGRAEKGLKEHRAVLEAMRRGDSEEAERLKRANIRSAIEDLQRYKHFVF